MYTLSMFIHFPKYKHRISNASPGLILGGLIFGKFSAELPARERVTGGG